MGGVPGVHAADDVEDFSKALAEKQAGDDAGAIAAGTDEMKRTTRGKLGEIFRDFAGVNVAGLGDVTCVPFGIGAHIENKGILCTLRVELLDGNLLQMRLRIAGIEPGTEATVEIAFDAVETDADETAAGVLNSGIAIGEEEKRAIVRHNPASPKIERRTGSDVDGTRDVGAAKSFGAAEIKDDGILVFNVALEIPGAESTAARNSIEELGPGGVETLHAAVIVRERRNAAKDAVDEGFAPRNGKKGIGVALITESGLRTLGHARAAERTGTVGRENFEAIRERGDFVRDAVKKGTCEATFGFFAEEIGAAKRADEHEVA